MGRYNQEADSFVQEVIAAEGEGFGFNRERILEDLNKNASNSGLAVKILSVTGGIFASAFFTGFLLLLGIWDSEPALLSTGIIFISASIVFTYITQNIIYETACVSFYLIGLILFSFGVGMLSKDSDITCWSLLFISLLSFFAGDNRLLKLFAVLVFNGSVVVLIGNSDNPHLLVIYTSILALAITAFSLNEARIITSSGTMNRSYGPARMGLLFSFLCILVMVQYQRVWGFHFFFQNSWILSVTIIACVLSLTDKVVGQYHLSRNQLLLIYPLVILLFLPGLAAPSLSGSLLIILLGFYMGHRVSFVMGVLALVYFVSLFYYNLYLSLLIKSMILMGTGVLFLGAYWLMDKKILK